MKEKNLRKTDGLPFYLGIASGILLLINTIININVKPLVSSAILKSQNLNITISPTANLIESIIGYVIYPGIFLILLLIGKNSPKRGKAFGIVWAILSGLSLLSSFSSAVLKSKTMEITNSIVNTVVPGGMALYTAIEVLENALMLASCIIFLTRFSMPEKESDISRN